MDVQDRCCMGWKAKKDSTSHNTKTICARGGKRFDGPSRANVQLGRRSRRRERHGRIDRPAEIRECHTLRHAIAQKFDGARAEIKLHADHVARATKLLAVLRANTREEREKGK